MILFTLSILVLIYSILNIILNGKTKYWEITTIIPTLFPILVITVILILAVIAKDTISITFSIASLFLLAPSLDYSFFSFNKENSKKKIKILDMNNLYFYPKNPQELVSFIDKQNVDIICLQELWTTDEVEWISKKPLLKFPSLRIYTEDEIKNLFPKDLCIITSADRAIISKTPLEKISEYIQENYFCKFGYIIAKTDINNHEISIINVHMPIKLNKYFGFEERREAFESLYKDIKEFQKDNKRFIITGDFNTTKSSKFIQKLFKILPEGIVENNVGIFSSWHVQKLPLWRLDFLFHSRNIICSDAKLVKNKYSDHKHIEAEFSID